MFFGANGRLSNLLKTCVAVLLILMTGSVVVRAEAINLNAVTFPERDNLKLEFDLTSRAPRAEIEAVVEHEEGQTWIEVRFKDMKPAVLFGGDVTCYVVWAVLRDGTADNLGELWFQDDHGKDEFISGGKTFALMITAEAYSLVKKPSDLVIARNRGVTKRNAPTTTFEFSNFAESPEFTQKSITNIAWDSNTPLDLMQAEKAYELAKRSGAEKYAGAMMRDAKIALGQAQNLASRTKKRLDYSRRSISMSSEAIQITERRKEAEELQRQIDERRAEMEALEGRAKEAEERSAEARRALEEAQKAIAQAKEQQSAAVNAVQRKQAELAQIAQEREAAMQAKEEALRAKEEANEQKRALEVEQAALLSSLEEMRAESERLRQEREELSNRLEGALSMVAETKDSARGLIVNLPDILFDLNKAALKPEAKVVIAKMAGILLIMPELNVRVEGHTDATGSADYNQELSEDRAQSVRRFLVEQGIDIDRVRAVGYGEDRPVASNDTADGRKKNRRVEIIIAEGEIGEK